VNEVTLFRHFGSKAALLHEALQCAARRNAIFRLPEVPVNPEAELMAWSLAHLTQLRRSKSMIRTCMGEFEQAPDLARRAGAVPTGIAEEMKVYLQRLQDLGMADADLDPDSAAAMLMGTLFSDAMGRDIMPGRYGYTEDEAPEKYVTLFLRAIGSDSHQPRSSGKQTKPSPGT
jgi:AcrR family transcriptional regulator